ncbi:MAG: hypothetical protein HETSPECPRED_006918 [Heterodermia speciosa]|uniref:Sin3-associated polypeptide Sap18 n=1 Tax=Heterodermia speciosa TaxID=116794 RepID=A0A8H3FWM3_9LECA|nr:MAG: hypothetical protein HETSPECPRED_006918 [Heterodermia speciosa]
MASAPAKIDRQTTTPFHLKLFYKTGGFHRLDEFLPSSSSTSLPPHLQIYTWPTCSLRELSHLLLTALPSLLTSSPTTTPIGTRLAYRLIYPDTRAPPSAPPRYIAKELGSIVVGGDGEGGGIWPSEEELARFGGNGDAVMKGKLGGEPEKTLQEARFVVGDFVDCAVFEAGGDGAIAAAPRGGEGLGRGGGGGGGVGRENGFGSGYRGRAGGGMMGGGVRGGGGGGGGMYNGRLGGEGVPSGEWRRGERIPEGPGRGGYGRGRGRGY